jgi:predicted membrane channel-forming protein YqfA (hemolysin III family)
MNNWMLITRFLGTRLAIYLAAVAITYLLATVSATQSVVSSLSGMGIELDFSERSAMTLSDIAGMAGMFVPMIAFGLLVAFMATALICRYWRRWRTFLYVLAGATAIVCIHQALNLAFGITPIAIARTTSGLVVQALAGAVGGFTFVYLSDRFPGTPRRREPDGP